MFDLRLCDWVIGDCWAVERWRGGVDCVIV